jgi:hypothetical protein
MQQDWLQRPPVTAQHGPNSGRSNLLKTKNNNPNAQQQQQKPP